MGNKPIDVKKISQQTSQLKFKRDDVNAVQVKDT